jgi:dienelactone hydrolase
LAGFGQALPGFTLTGETWTYDPGDGGSVLTGILSRPPGSGPFPATLISHGQGGSAIGFALPNAHILTNWGLVGIGPDYTHVTSTPPENSGWCPENGRRANACLTILRSLAYVDPNRIAAYGHSMGAFVTAGFCGQVTNQLRAAAITSGGTSGTTNASYASPATQEVQGITAPFLMLHGTADTTVSPTQSANLQTILNSSNIPNSRILLDGAGHDLEHERSNEVYSAIHDWFGQWGVLSATNSSSTNTSVRQRPRGIFVLDSAQGSLIGGVSMRDANVRSNAFVTGYVLRAAWQTLETSREVYNFTMISNILARLQPLGQKLSLIIIPNDPPYVAATPGVTTWVDQDQSGNPLTRAVPWDPFLLQQRAKFLAALAAGQFGGLALSNHPTLQVINPYLAGGFTGIRDPVVAQLRNLPGYSRSNLLNAVQSELRALTASFPGKFVQLGFWKVLDGENGAYGNVDCWEYLRRQLLAEFDGLTKPRVGFFMENLGASRPAPGQDPVTGYPVTGFGTPMFLSQTNTWNGFQALTSWHQPFTGATQVTNGTPADGIRFGFETYGATYFELYASDIDYAPNLIWLTDWKERLTAAAAEVQIARQPSGSGVTLTWDRASPNTSVQFATNLASGFQALFSVTNAFAWTNTTPISNLPRAFYRLSQRD